MFQRYTQLADVSDEGRNLHLALGVFDGVHVGHQAVIGEAVRRAAADGGRALVITFSPHPIQVIAPTRAPSSLLATLDEKARVLENLGVHGMVAVKFDRQFAKLGAEEFIKMIANTQAKSVCVGEDWRFGKDRLGDVPMLRKIGERCGFAVHAVPPVMGGGERISSTRIRQAIRDGNFSAVERMLGRTYSVVGVVQEGQKIRPQARVSHSESRAGTAADSSSGSVAGKGRSRAARHCQSWDPTNSRWQRHSARNSLTRL